jgi:hypothetical protein
MVHGLSLLAQASGGAEREGLTREISAERLRTAEVRRLQDFAGSKQ